jgi:hypothetical protein
VQNLEVQADKPNDNGEALFEVRRSDGYPVFAVYENEVWVYTDTATSAKGPKGGFAVGGYSRNTKGPAEEFLRVTPDSTRVNVRISESKGPKGGISVGGYSRNTKSPPGDAFMSLGQENYFIGHRSGTRLTGGRYNSVLGYESGAGITIGEGNAFMGYQSGFLNSTGSGNLFLGYQSGHGNISGNFNTFIGYRAGYANRGTNNTFLGSFAGLSNREGSYNTFVGDSAGVSNTFGESNSFFGTKAGVNNTTGWSNVFMGHEAGISNTTGYANVFIGFAAGRELEDAGGNVMIGNEAGRGSVNGWNNIYLGTRAGANNTEGEGNVFLGYESGMNSATGDGSIFIGTGAGHNETGEQKLYLGHGYFDSTQVFLWGDFIHKKARFNSRVGIDTHPEWANLEVGSTWGPAAVRIRGNSDDYNYSLLLLESDEEEDPKTYAFAHTADHAFSLHYYDNQTFLPRFRISPDGNIVLGMWENGTELLDVGGNARFRGVGSAASANDLRITADGTLTTNTSDKRLKEDLRPLEDGLERVLKMQGYTFTWTSGVRIRDAGLMDQDVKNIYPEAVFRNEVDGYYGINYSRFPALLIEAIKEQQGIIEDQEAEIRDLEDSYKVLSRRLKELEEMLGDR